MLAAFTICLRYKTALAGGMWYNFLVQQNCPRAKILTSAVIGPR